MLNGSDLAWRMLQENKTLLIVDDEPETLKGYADFLTPRRVRRPANRSSRCQAGGRRRAGLRRAGYGELQPPARPSPARRRIELVKSEMAAGRRVAAGFFDVKLEGGMDGLATIAAIKAIDKDLHCVVVTAYHDRTVEEINQLFGEDFKDQWDYLNKPFTQGEIVQKARQMVAAWNRKRELDATYRQLVRSERLAAVGRWRAAWVTSSAIFFCGSSARPISR